MRRTTLGGVAAAALLTVVAASPAQAVDVHPSTVRLANPSGAENGCVGTIPKFKLSTFTEIGGRVTPGVRMSASITCPAAAKVGRLTWKVYLFEVLKNGTLRGMNGPAGLMGSAAQLFDKPLTGPYAPFGDFGPLCGPNYPQNAGKRTWLVRANFHTHHSKTDPVAFVGHFDRQQTVDCH
jgi:hypothetical protein